MQEAYKNVLVQMILPEALPELEAIMYPRNSEKLFGCVIDTELKYGEFFFN